MPSEQWLRNLSSAKWINNGLGVESESPAFTSQMGLDFLTSLYDNLQQSCQVINQYRQQAENYQLLPLDHLNKSFTLMLGSNQIQTRLTPGQLLVTGIHIHQFDSQSRQLALFTPVLSPLEELFWQSPANPPLNLEGLTKWILEQITKLQLASPGGFA